MYCERSDIEAVFGSENVEIWGNLNAGDVADQAVKDAITTRITLAIAHAGEVVDAAFRPSKYIVPLAKADSSTPGLIVDTVARLAGAWLYESRGTDEVDADGRPVNRYAAVRRDAMSTIDRILGGQYVIEAVQAPSVTTAPFVVN